jgi:hypothetical protein
MWALGMIDDDSTTAPAAPPWGKPGDGCGQAPYHRRRMYLTINATEKCVMARITRQRVRHQANFTLRQYGSWRKATAAAKAWVDATLPTLPARVARKDLKTTRNTSGVVGVRLANATRSRNGHDYPDWRWVAFWPGCAQASGIGWSVNKYGDGRAFVSACLARRLESLNRKVIDAKVERLRGSAEYRALLRKKRLSPP